MWGIVGQDLSDLMPKMPGHNLSQPIIKTEASGKENQLLNPS